MAKKAGNSSTITLQEIFRRFIRNAAMILGSRLTFGLLNLGTSALIVAYFSLEVLGVVLLLQVYVRLFTDLIKFDSWQAILSFGAKMQEQENPAKLRSLLGLTLGLDLACIAFGTFCAILFTPFAADIFEWPKNVTDFAPYFALSIIFLVQGTQIGVLRLFDRVDILAIQFALNASIRFGGATLAAFLGGNVFHIVIAWFLANIISGAVPIIFSFKELKARQLLPTFNVNWRQADQHFHRLWRFLFFSNISSSFTFIYFSGTVAFVGAIMTPAAAAALQITQQFAIAISRPASIMGPLISPELAKLAARGDWLTFRLLIKRQLIITIIVLTALGSVLYAVLGFIIDFVYGQELVEYLWLFQVMIAASLITMATFSFKPAILSANKPTLLLALRGAAAALYLIISAALFSDFGIYAFGYGFLAAQVAYVAAFSTLGTRILNRRIKDKPKA